MPAPKKPIPDITCAEILSTSPPLPVISLTKILIIDVSAEPRQTIICVLMPAALPCRALSLPISTPAISGILTPEKRSIILPITPGIISIISAELPARTSLILSTPCKS